MAQGKGLGGGGGSDVLASITGGILKLADREQGGRGLTANFFGSQVRQAARVLSACARVPAVGIREMPVHGCFLQQAHWARCSAVWFHRLR